MTDTPRYPSDREDPAQQSGATPLRDSGSRDGNPVPPAAGYPPPPAGDGVSGGGYFPPPPASDGSNYGPPHYGAASSPAYGPPPSQGYGAMAPSGYGPPTSALSPADERTWGMLAHLSAFPAALVALSPLGPLLVMLIQGPKSAFVRQQAVEALNFQLTTYILGAISFVLAFVLIGFVTGLAVFIGWIVFTILASVAANRGENYRYPINFRLVK